MRLTEYQYLTKCDIAAMARVIKVSETTLRSILHETKRAERHIARAIVEQTDNLVSMQDFEYSKTYKELSFEERDQSLKRARQQLAQRELVNR